MQNDTADQSANITRLLLRDLMAERPGIIQESAFKVTQRGAGANNSVDVAAGGIIVPGNEAGTQGYYYIVNDAVVNVPMATGANATNPRIDKIIVRARDSFYSGVDNDANLVYVTGTAAASPVPPDIAALGYKNYFELAQISVPANDNTIATADITDLRLANSKYRATAPGGIIVCTSGTKPTNPRTGQFIWLSDSKRVEVNEGTSVSPVWQTYAVPGTGEWLNYTPTFNTLTGGSNTTYGRYFRMGTLIVGICGFTIGAGGNITATPAIEATIPPLYPVHTTGVAASAVHIGFGRAFDSSAGTYWSATAEIALGSDHLGNFATAGQGGWNGTVPFNWDPSDRLHMFFAYETSA